MDRKRILVVDDEPAVSSVLTQLLENTGEYEVCEVNDPFEAVDLAGDFEPHLAVLDIVMPGMDGGDLLVQLRALDGMSELPAVFLTGLVSEAEVGEDGYEINGQPVLAKPVRIDVFRETVARRLR